MFPKGWFDVSSDSQCLVFSKIEERDVIQVYNYTVDLILNLTAIVCIQLSYTLKVTYDFLWTFQIQGEVVNLSSAHLAPLPSKLQSALDVLKMLQSIESSSFCVGNEDNK